MEEFINEWREQGDFWARDVHKCFTFSHIRQANDLYPKVVTRLHELGELQQVGCTRRVWDYCLGDFGDDPVTEIIDELL